MITIKVTRNDNNEIIGFSLNGHAGYSENGKDIVCAAVSAVTNMTLIGLGERLKLNMKFERNDGGYLKVELPKDISADDMRLAQFLLESLVTEYLDIEANFGKYVLVNER